MFPLYAYSRLCSGDPLGADGFQPRELYSAVAQEKASAGVSSIEETQTAVSDAFRKASESFEQEIRDFPTLIYKPKP